MPLTLTKVNHGTVAGDGTGDGAFDAFADVNTTFDAIKVIADSTESTANAAAVSGGAEHDNFSDYVAAEHIDWTNATDNFSTTGQVAVGQLIVGTSTLNPMYISSDTGASSGANIILHPSNHVNAYDINFRAGTDLVLSYYRSALSWDFQDNAITTTGAITGSNLSGTNTGDQTSIVGITGTKSQFDTACSDGNFAYSGGAFHDGFSDYVANEHIDWTGTSENFDTSGTAIVGAGFSDDAKGVFKANQQNALGTNLNDNQVVAQFVAGNTSNDFKNMLFVVRDTAAGTDWTTTRWHDAITVDTVYDTPRTDTRTWYERDPLSGSHHWGNAATEYLELSSAGANFQDNDVTMGSATTLTVGVGADNGTVSAGIFTDRTKYYDGDALAELKTISGVDGQIDHASLPAFAKASLVKPIYEEQDVVIDPEAPVKKGETVLTGKQMVKIGEETVVERDLGAMVSILTTAVQQLTARLEAAGL